MPFSTQTYFVLQTMQRLCRASIRELDGQQQSLLVFAFNLNFCFVRQVFQLVKQHPLLKILIVHQHHDLALRSETNNDEAMIRTEECTHAAAW